MKANKFKSLLEDKAEELRSMIESNMQSKGNVEVDAVAAIELAFK